jgi:hypothetical protein
MVEAVKPAPVTVMSEFEKLIPDLSSVPAASHADLLSVLDKYKSIFASEPPAGLPPNELPCRVCPLEPGAKPVFRSRHRMSPWELEEVEKQVTSLLEKGLIEPSISPFGAPVLFVPKQNGTFRMVIDYRELNKITIKGHHPVPRIDDIIDKFRGAYVFSNLDMASAYNQFRLQPEDVEATAFVCPRGEYQWRVLSFGLSNAPSAFCRALGEILRPLHCVVIYLDDIAILSKTHEEHLHHLDLVFARLKEFGLIINLKKCSFMQPQIKFLGHILSARGVEADPAKLQVLQDWPEPKDKTELQRFLGLGNYFRKRVPDFSRIAAPMHHLVKIGVPFVFDRECHSAFEELKKRLREPPCLAYPDPDLPYELISDASMTGCGAVLTQAGRPVAYYSAKFSPAESNYTTTEQEMLGVIKALKEWRCYLEGCKGTLTVITDHNPNTYFPKTVLLSGRQARWAEFLSRFRMIWQHTPGKDNPADPLSRLHEGLVRSAAICAAISLTHDFLYRIPAAYSADLYFSDHNKLKRAGCVLHNNMWTTSSGQIIVPQVIRQDIMTAHHDDKWAGHFGVDKTADLIKRHFWWPSMHKDITDFVAQCPKCQVNKNSTQAPAGLLQPLPIPDSRWHTVTLDFITGFPRSKEGYDSILVFVDKLSKYVILVPCRKTCSTEQFARYFTDHVVTNHGVPEVLISDRDTRFTSKYWREFCVSHGVKPRFSTAFHPETDGQTERVNKVVEEVLRNLLSGDNSDWSRLLSYVQFSINNAKHASTNYSPFYLNYGRHPRSPLTNDIAAFKSSARFTSSLPALSEVLQEMEETLSRVKRLLQGAQERQKLYADKHRRPHHITEGMYVLLSSKNLRFTG